MSKSHGCRYGFAALVPRSLSQTPRPWVPTSGVTISARLPLAWPGREGACRSRGRPVPAVEGGRLQLVPDLGQLETSARVSGPAGPDEVWHEPGAQRLLEGECHGAGLGLDELAGGGHPVVELVRQRVDVPLENRARVSHLRRPAMAQQRRAGLRLQAPQSSTAPFERAPAGRPRETPRSDVTT